jgi:hypothetical protein
MELDLQCVCHVMCTAVLIGWDSAAPTRGAIGQLRRHLHVIPCLQEMVAFQSLESQVVSSQAGEE